MAFISLILVIFTPWICIPYSDIPAFALTCYILGIIIKNHRSQHPKLAYWLIIGLLAGLNYLIKPSTFIIMISLVIVEIAFILKGEQKDQILKTIMRMLLMLLMSFSVISAFGLYRSHNNYVHINKNDELSALHFAAMGSHGTGGYNLSDVQRDVKIHSSKTRNRKDLQVWIKHIHDQGFSGYQTFLIKKQINNTADGSFSWGVEGVFLKPFHALNKISLLFISKDGIAHQYNSFIGLIVQVVWCITLLNMLFINSNNKYLELFIKASIVGFMTFLLIFEGGRSRYVIQFLPFILIGSSMGMDHIYKYLTDQKYSSI